MKILKSPKWYSRGAADSTLPASEALRPGSPADLSMLALDNAQDENDFRMLVWQIPG